MIDVAYIFVALTGAVLAIYVMQKTEHDRINKVDPLWLQWIRRLAFIIVALALCYSILDQSWHRSLAVLLLVMAGVGNLTVNALALHMRSPPDRGRTVFRMIGNPNWSWASFLKRLEDVKAMDQGQEQ